MNNQIINQIKKFTNQLYSCKSYAGLVNLVKKNKNLDNPYLYQASGQWCLSKNLFEEALPYFKKSILYGCDFPNKIWNTQLSDSIGSSIAMILTAYKTNFKEKSIVNLFIVGYSYLSNCIELLDVNAFESLSNRAMLVEESDSLAKSGLLFSALPVGFFTEVYAISDYYRAAIGLKTNGYGIEAKKKLDKAIYLHNWLEDISVAGKDADEYNIHEIAMLGIERHKLLFMSFKKKLLNNEYNISETDLNQIFDSLTKK